MKRIALALPLLVLCTGCVARPAAPERLSESEWRFVQIDDYEPAEPDGARLSFGEEDVSASVGCNTMVGKWRVEQGRLIAGPLAGTRMFCQGDVWEQEQAVAALLVAAPTLEWQDADRLTLRSRGHSAELTRISVSPPQPGS
ncbi:META domain-containing protein [Pelagerythrobacter rhizovicinus]|uniref:META domain-containing protein n=1 Tax=Pelagerythrobacter rhizovicinus TaxID=2268576 RepID=A0A4Q2KR91_9SPHN|nr:META domain-containing protein [Pelagerythrobacter rhizovicinus]